MRSLRCGCMQVDLRQQVAALFEEQAASVALHSALYAVRCLTKHVQLLGVHNTSFARSLWSGIDNVYTQVCARMGRGLRWPVPNCMQQQCS